MIVLDYLGLLFICYAVYRALKAWADGMERRAYVRDVMTGRSLAPWETRGGYRGSASPGPIIRPTSAGASSEVRVRRGIYDQDNER